MILCLEAEKKSKNTKGKIDINSSSLPLSSSAKAVLASCKLSELLEVLSPKFKAPRLTEAAILKSHIP